MNNQAIIDAYYNFTPRECDAWMFEHAVYRQQIEAQIINYPAYALPSLASPSALCGIVVGLGVGDVWLVTGEHFRKNSIIIAGQLKQLCHAAYEVFNLNRIQMKVDSDRDDAKYFAEKLGFVCEARALKNMGVRGNNIDLYFLERIKT